MIHQSRLSLELLIASSVLCVSASAQELRPRRPTYVMAEASRPFVIGLKHETGLCTGVVIDSAQGIIATSKARLAHAGAIEGFLFQLPPDMALGTRPRAIRTPLGPLNVMAIHKDLDLALLRTENTELLTDIAPAADAALPQDVFVVGLPDGISGEDMLDLYAREGSISRGETGGSVIPLEGGVYLSSSGGAVVDKQGGLLGLASWQPSADPTKRMVPLSSIRELMRERAAFSLSDEAIAEHTKPASGPPSYIALSPAPGGPPGKHVSFGQGVTAIKEARAIVATGVFVLDRHEPLEYLVCALKNGKLHETVIATDADPAVINLAMIALKYRPGGGVERLGDTSVPFGDKVTMYVEWDHNEAVAIRKWLLAVDPPWKQPNHSGVLERKSEGAIKWEKGPITRVRLEDLAFDLAACRTMEHIEWIYTGSSFGRDPDTNRRYYKASTDGVFAAVFRDPIAVLNSPLRTGTDDTSYLVNDAVVPPRGTSCILIIEPAPEPAEDDE